MRILVISDSHGKAKTVIDIIKFHPDINHVFFLGDTVGDIEAAKEYFPQKNYYIVMGNCDIFGGYKKEDVAVLENTRIFYCHGHRYGVKYSTEHLSSTAKEKNCTLALYGHSHRSLLSYDDGLYIVNPGSVFSAREGKESYAIVDIDKSGIMPSLLYVENLYKQKS